MPAQKGVVAGTALWKRPYFTNTEELLELAGFYDNDNAYTSTVQDGEDPFTLAGDYTLAGFYEGSGAYSSAPLQTIQDKVELPPTPTAFGPLPSSPPSTLASSTQTPSDGDWGYIPYGWMVAYKLHQLAGAKLPEDAVELEKLSFYMSDQCEERWRKYGDPPVLSPKIHPYHPFWLPDHAINKTIAEVI
jgi:hypothetical protein